MPAIVRIGDSLTTGHLCATVTTIASSNQTTVNVYANTILIDVVGAPTVPHIAPPIPLCPIHVRILNVGSSSVFINGINVGRIGDSADAGAMITGSSNVFAGG
jgi:uncharacterized Zn-binding protein involved in type VI secretion